MSTPLSSTPAAQFLSAFPSLSTSHTPLPDDEGQLVGGYTLATVIGHGAFSIIRRAHSTSGGIVAVKIVRRSAVSKQPDAVQARKKLDHETAVWSALSHEHILPLLSAVHSAYADYFFTLYCPAGSLFDILKRDGRPALPHDDAGMMFRQVVQGLRYMHDVAGYFHRDIKLENVLVDEMGVCRISGFDMSHKIGEIDDEDEDEEDQIDFLSHTAHTGVHRTALPASNRRHQAFQSGHNSVRRHSVSSPNPQIFNPGSLPYVAPELLMPRTPPLAPNPSQDIWALGVMLYALLIGRLPFSDSFEPRLQMKICNGIFEIPLGIGRSAERVLRDDVAWGAGWGTEGDDVEDEAHQSHISESPRFVNGLDILKEFASFSALHDSSAQDPQRCCHPHTRERVLDKIRNWAVDPSTPERILWLHGLTGVGKSAITRTISDSYGQDQIGASFFFFRSDPNRNDGNRLFPTLAWRLASSVPIIKDLIAFSLKEDPDLPRKSIEAQFDRLIARPFLTISGGESEPLTRVIVIDGLDECSDVRLQQRILKIIGRAVANPHFPLRFLISSRPEAHIEDFFTQFQYPNQINLADVDEASRDIEAYFTSEFTRIAVERKFDPSWPGQQIMQGLVSKSAGYFAYAANVIRLVGDPYNDALTQLDIILGLKPLHTTSPFAELDQPYLEILSRMPDKDFLMTFLSLLIAHNSILDDSLSNDNAMLMDISRVELEIKLRRIRAILNFKPYVDVVHKSFLDCLEDSSRSGQYHVSRSAGMRRYLQLITKLLIGHVARLTTQPDFHGSDHFAPEFGKLINRNPQAIKLDVEDWEHILHPLLNVLNRLLVPSNIDSLKAGLCQECQFFQITFDTLTHFKSLREREDPDVEKCLKSLEEIGYGDPERRQQIFDMNFGRYIFGSTAIVGIVMAILAHQR